MGGRSQVRSSFGTQAPPWSIHRARTRSSLGEATQLDAAKVAGIGISTLGRCLRPGDRVEMSHVRVRPGCGALNLSEHEEIRVGIEAGESDTAIAKRIGRHRSTVWREITANGGRRRYRAALAEGRTAHAARRPKALWTEERSWLWTEVQELLRTKKWSPEQIARRLRKEHPDQPGGVPRGHLPGHLHSSQRPAAQGAGSLPAVGPGLAAASDTHFLRASADPRHGQHFRAPSRRPQTGLCRATGRAT